MPLSGRIEIGAHMIVNPTGLVATELDLSLSVAATGLLRRARSVSFLDDMAGIEVDSGASDMREVALGRIAVSSVFDHLYDSVFQANAADDLYFGGSDQSDFDFEMSLDSLADKLTLSPVVRFINRGLIRNR
jgi:hypothetical protein